MDVNMKMRRQQLRSGLLAVSVLAATFLVCGQASAETKEKAAGQTICGQVVDREGKPLKKAEVFLYYSEGTAGVFDRFIEKSKTKGKGRFAFRNAASWNAGQRTIDSDAKPKFVVLAKHGKEGIGFVCITPDDALESLTVRLFGPKMDRFNVKDAAGKPVEGALVFLTFAGFPESEAKRIDGNHRWAHLDTDIGISSGVTDAAGHIELVSPPEGSFRVHKPGYAEGYYNNTDIILFPSARVSGQVTFPDDSPARGAVVLYEYQGNSLSWSDCVLADDEGRYVFEEVPAAGFRYSWMKPEEEAGNAGMGKIRAKDVRADSEFLAKSILFPIQAGDKLVKDVQFARGMIFAGNVLDLVTGKPGANVKFNIHIETGGRYLDTIRMKTDAEGRFQTVLAPDSKASVQWENAYDEANYIIDEDWLRQGNQQPYRGVVSANQENLTFRVKLRPVHPLTGKVLDTKGAPVKDAKVFVHSSVAPAKTDAAGVFHLKTAPVDRGFSLYAETLERDQAAMVALEAGATEATLTLEPTRRLEGQVTTTDGLPAADLKFYADLSLNDSSFYQVREEPKTDKDGKFALEHAYPKAQYSVFWSADNDENRDYTSGRARFDLAALPEGAPIRFDANQYLNALMGRAVDEKGQPVVGARVQVSSSNLVQSSGQPVVTDAKGEFVVPRLAAGVAAVLVEAEGYKGVQVKSKTDAIDLSVVLKPDMGKYLVTAAVTGEDGAPIAGAALRLRKQIQDEAKTTDQEELKRTDAQGCARFTFSSKPKPLQSAYLVCDAAGYDLAFIAVGARRDTDAEIVLRKETTCHKGRVLDAAGAPIAGAVVKVTNLNPSPASGQEYVFLGENAVSFLTDADGRFALSRLGVVSGLSIEVSKKGYAAEKRWTDPATPGKELAVVLTQAGRITGRVVLKDTSQTVPVGEIVLAKGWDISVHPVNNDEGSFALEDLRPDFFTLHVKPPSKYVCSNPPSVFVAPGETKEVEIQVEEGVPVRGRLVRSAGELPKGDKIVRVDYEQQSFNVWPVKDDGSFELYLTPGEHTIRCEGEGLSGPDMEKKVTVEAGKPIEDTTFDIPG